MAADKPVVSFCIPVYNNAQAALTIVKELLRSEDSRFEVVVSDDNSREDVEGLLSEIRDSRFRYYRNEKNLGAHKNWEHTLELGRGEWLYLVMGRDMMHGEYITRLIEILEHAKENGITYLKDGYKKCGAEGEKVYSGIKAMCEFVKVEHPTGDIFRGEIFRAIPDIVRCFEISDMYPENNVRHYVLLRGKGAFIYSKAYNYGDKRLVDFTKVKSGVENGGNLWDMYYAPRRNIIQHLELEDMIDDDCPGIFTEEETDIFFRSNMRMLIWYTSHMWKKRNENHSWVSHYSQSVRYVGAREIISNIITSCSAVESHLQERGALSPARKKIIASCRTKSILYWGLYYNMKRAARKILQPIGIWSVLRYMKKCIKKIPRP